MGGVSTTVPCRKSSQRRSSPPPVLKTLLGRRTFPEHGSDGGSFARVGRSEGIYSDGRNALCPSQAQIQANPDCVAGLSTLPRARQPAAPRDSRCPLPLAPAGLRTEDENKHVSGCCCCCQCGSDPKRQTKTRHQCLSSASR